VGRVAHFLLLPELASSPPNEALISAYLELGYSVDLYAPGGALTHDYGAAVSVFDTEFGIRWLIKNALRAKWRKYSAFSGTSEDPLAIVGLLSALHQRPVVALADEIKSDAYSGDRSQRWKELCRFGMRRAGLTIVNDAKRIDLQRSYAGLTRKHLVTVYPGGYRDPPTPVDHHQQRLKWGMRDASIVIGSSGGFNLSAGADWLIEALETIPDLCAVLQPLAVGPLSRFLLRHLAMRDRIYIEPERLDWRDAWSQAAAIDIGMAVYKNTASQFQLMGTSSNRLCMFLAMGVPVIASRQDSFKFLEEYQCGVLVDDSAGFVAAIREIRARLPEMKANARSCWHEYVATEHRYNELVFALRRLLGRPEAERQM
jgi:glycosyltransferase involved in cell wall biosynthesis